MSRHPGYSKEDAAKPPSRVELARRGKELRAVTLWYQLQDEDAVRKEMRLRSKFEARVLINRGLKRYEAERMDAVERVRVRQAMDLERLREGTIDRAAEGNDQATLTMLKIQEREAKLYGSDKQHNDHGSGLQVFINTQPPWEREEPIEGESVPFEELPSGNEKG